MEEYNKINWRENMLEEDNVFLDQESYKKSYMHQFFSGTLNIPSIQHELESLNKVYKPNQDYPGKKYYPHNAKSHLNSAFNTIEQQRLISALKVLQSGRLNLNKFELSERELLNNCKAQILAENEKYFKWAEDSWNIFVKGGIKINNGLFKYALEQRMQKLNNVLSLEQYYVPVDALPWNYSLNDVNVQMIHTANVLDLGSVSQYIPPLLEEPYTLDPKLLPSAKTINYYSKLPISCDRNIDDFINTGNADIAISLSALKKIFHYTETNQLWTIPVTIKCISLSDGRKKKIIFFDKPLPKQLITNVDLNLRSHKLMVRSNFCRLEGFRYQQQDKILLEDSQTSVEVMTDNVGGISHNVAYKLWALKEEACENSLMLKHHSTKLFNVLVRTKNDACRSCDFGLQSVTVVPKLEYQLKFGANVITDREIVAQWTDLTFRPSSVLQRIRTHYLTSEVVKIESVTLDRVCLEATHHNLKPHSALVVFYKMLLGLEQHDEGTYLLRHEAKLGKFVSLLKCTKDDLAPSVFDLHKEYATNASIEQNYCKPWTPIDPNVLLPAFEFNGHFPGLYKPPLPQAKPKQKPWSKKKNKKKGISQNITKKQTW